jgi:uncharacterized protein
MAAAEEGVAIDVDVVYGLSPHQFDLSSLRVAAGTTVEQALKACGLLERQGLILADLSVGVWGRVCALDRALRDRDRVEVYRPLTVDPKEARRLRYKRSRTAR